MALNMLEQFYYDFQKKGIHIVLSGVNPVPLETMQRARFIDIILERAYYILTKYLDSV